MLENVVRTRKNNRTKLKVSKINWKYEKVKDLEDPVVMDKTLLKMGEYRSIEKYQLR